MATIRRGVTRAVLAVIPLSVALAACGGADSESTSGATRPEPATHRATHVPYSPDAGIAEGHSVADARARRCRDERPAYTRAWRACGRLAR
jgi:hypothetical protein